MKKFSAIVILFFLLGTNGIDACCGSRKKAGQIISVNDDAELFAKTKMGVRSNIMYCGRPVTIESNKYQGQAQTICMSEPDKKVCGLAIQNTVTEFKRLRNGKIESEKYHAGTSLAKVGTMLLFVGTFLAFESLRGEMTLDQLPDGEPMAIFKKNYGMGGR